MKTDSPISTSAAACSYFWLCSSMGCSDSCPFCFYRGPSGNRLLLEYMDCDQAEPSFCQRPVYNWGQPLSGPPVILPCWICSTNRQKHHDWAGCRSGSGLHRERISISWKKGFCPWASPWEKGWRSWRLCDGRCWRSQIPSGCRGVVRDWPARVEGQRLPRSETRGAWRVKDWQIFA